nr:hypothetical protein [Xanthomonas dyei]
MSPTACTLSASTALTLAPSMRMSLAERSATWSPLMLQPRCSMRPASMDTS